MPDEELTEAISMRITRDDKELLEELASRFPIKALTIARIGLRLGLAQIKEDPGALLRPIDDRKAMQTYAKDLLAKADGKPKSKK